ncbi:acidic leucine-rich nuclear phosphoprotein 32 family member B-like [Gossypium australe]|uniref:Acidic leucine-rich nuclear phosphoprotein 32 family member B-like n=1 Tax=Gossypium australe TaxID=47621 RepID=A0A5B6UZ49_9ROSI|nr:acidic leucine-rich nuclear phosphoprotein 32 family member B-like [Gossypium australe]
MRTNIKQVQFECTNSTRTLTKLEDQMSQLMSKMGDIKSQIGIGKEHVKVIALRSSKVLSILENPTQEMNKENTDDLQEEPL